MNIYGNLPTVGGKIVRVTINSPEEGEDIIIGENGVFFSSSEAVTIENCVNDTQDAILRQRLTVNLVSDRFIPELYASGGTKMKVMVADEMYNILFSGFVEPQIYDMSFTSVAEDVEVACVDALSALSTKMWGDAVNLSESEWTAARGATRMATMQKVIEKALHSVGLTSISWDGSKSLSDGRSAMNLEVSEALFFGDDADSVWTMEEVLDAMLRYLGLQCCQEGSAVRIFSRSSRRSGCTPTWVPLSETATDAGAPEVVGITNGNIYGTDTRISMTEAYDLVTLTCEAGTSDEVLTGPMAEEYLSSDYSGAMRYFREFTYEHDQKKGFPDKHKDHPLCQILENMRDGKKIDEISGVTAKEWWMREMKNSAWTFFTPPAGPAQHDMADRMGRGIYAGLWNFGSCDFDYTREDDSVEPFVKTSTSLILSCNGNGSADGQRYYPRIETLNPTKPMAVYEVKESIGAIAPLDPAVTNYIVMSGKIALTKWIDQSRGYAAEGPGGKYFGVFDQGEVSTTRIWYKDDGYLNVQNNDMPLSVADDPGGSRHRPGAMPFTDNGAKIFKHDGAYDGTDAVRKIPALRCMMIIGEGEDAKYLSEGGSTPGDMRWQKFKQRGECKSLAEFYSQSFTLGFNPKKEDYIIGQQYEIANNIPASLGIDAEGMGAAVRFTDALRGKVQFIIIGPAPGIWDEQYHTFKDYTDGWFPSQSERFLPAFVQYVVLEDFKIEVISDNGRLGILNPDEIVYTTDTATPGCDGKKLELEAFRVMTPLSKDLMKELNAEEVTGNSVVYNPLCQEGAPHGYTIISSDGREGTAEELYLDEAWAEWQRSRITMEISIKDDDLNRDFGFCWKRYQHPALDKEMYVTGYSRDFMAGSITLYLKEHHDQD